MVTKLADEKEVGLAMGGWFLSIAMAQYVAGIIAALASGGTNSGGHGEETVAATIGQYSGIYMQLFWIGLDCRYHLPGAGTGDQQVDAWREIRSKKALKMC